MESNRIYQRSCIKGHPMILQRIEVYHDVDTMQVSVTGQWYCPYCGSAQKEKMEYKRVKHGML